MKKIIQYLRHLTQFTIIIFILTMPFIAQYGEYLYQYKSTHFLEQWPSSFQKNSLSIIKNIVSKKSDSNPDKTLTSLQKIRGNTWSAQIFKLSLTDPLGGLGSIAASKSFSKKLFLSLLIPILITLLLGRIFCSWICPIGFILEMSEKLRKILSFFKIRTRNITFARSSKYILLITGLILSFIISRPLLNELYPPALIGQEVQHEVQSLFEQTKNNQFDFNLKGLTGISLFIFSIILIEILFSKRLWCRYICPGGALYSLLGRYRPIRIRRNEKKCTDCTDCVKVCPMGLNPMNDQTGMECDNCLACVSICSTDALNPHVSLKTTPIKEKKKILL